MELLLTGNLLTGIGLALPAGLNAYIPLLGVAMAQRAHVLALPAPYSLLGEWWVILIITALLVVEILADKVPAVDHVNDLIQTIVRPVTGAVLMVATTGRFGQMYPIVMIVAGVVLAGGVHAVKASARPVVNTTTAGIGGPVASLVEDLVAAVSTAVAILAPLLVIVVVAVAVWLGWRFVWKRRDRGKRAAAEAEAEAGGAGADEPSGSA
jgi:hypothetical protein